MDYLPDTHIFQISVIIQDFRILHQKMGVLLHLKSLQDCRLKMYLVDLCNNIHAKFFENHDYIRGMHTTYLIFKHYLFSRTNLNIYLF